MMFTLFAPWKSQQKTSPSRSLAVFVAALALVLIPHQSAAQVSVLNIGQQQMQWQQGQDRVKSSDGVECARSTAPRDKWFEVGTVAGALGGQGSDYAYQPVYTAADGTANVAPQNNYNRAGGGVWGKLVVNLDKQPAQIDCNRLYDLEIERLQEENRQLKMGAPNARPK